MLISSYYLFLGAREYREGPYTTWDSWCSAANQGKGYAMKINSSCFQYSICMYVLPMLLLNLELILFYRRILCSKIDLARFQLWQFLETSCGYAMNFKPSKARERFKDKCMIYFRNKEQCFECDGLLD